MAESLIQVTEGVGKKIHTYSRVIGANTIEDEFVVAGEYPMASYAAAPLAAVSTATAASHVFQLMAGASLNVRIRYLRISQEANATAAQANTLEIFRLTTAGTGGTAITPRPFDTADAAAGATAMSLPTAKGTEGVLLMREALVWRQVVSATQAQLDDQWEWYQKPGQKPIIIPAGTANGICIKNPNAIAGATLNVLVEFVETNYL
jgi:hypothetical protein